MQVSMYCFVRARVLKSIAIKSVVLGSYPKFNAKTTLDQVIKLMTVVMVLVMYIECLLQYLDQTKNQQWDNYMTRAYAGVLPYTTNTLGMYYLCMSQVEN